MEEAMKKTWCPTELFNYNQSTVQLYTFVEGNIGIKSSLQHNGMMSLENTQLPAQKLF
jgi:hypothetical protein